MWLFGVFLFKFWQKLILVLRDKPVLPLLSKISRYEQTLFCLINSFIINMNCQFFYRPQRLSERSPYLSTKDNVKSMSKFNCYACLPGEKWPGGSILTRKEIFLIQIQLRSSQCSSKERCMKVSGDGANHCQLQKMLHVQRRYPLTTESRRLSLASTSWLCGLKEGPIAVKKICWTHNQMRFCCFLQYSQSTYPEVKPTMYSYRWHTWQRLVGPYTAISLTKNVCNW